MNTDNYISSDYYNELISKYPKDLVDKEIELEIESKEIGFNKFFKTLNSVCKHLTGTTKSLTQNAIPIMSKALDEWHKEANLGKTGKKHSLSPVIKALDSDTISYIAIKTVFQILVSHKTVMNATYLAIEIAKEVESQLRFETFIKDYTDNGKTEKKIKQSVSKRIGVSYKAALLKAYEQHSIDEGVSDTWKPWSHSKRAQIGIKLLEIFMSSTGMGCFYKIHNTPTDTRYIFGLNQQILQYVEENNKELAELAFYNRPMIIPPKPWTGIFGGGYHILLKRPTKFIRIPSRELKERYSDVDMPQVYQCVNTIQQTPWRINKKVYDVAKEIASWDNIPCGLDMPTMYPAEPPYRSPECDTDYDMQFAWRKSMVRYYQEDNKRKSKRLLTNLILGLSEVYKDYDAIYFPHNLDFRGRVYPLTVLSPQGNDLQKSLLEFSKGKPIGSEGVKWLAMHGANCFGLDKKDLEERLTWVYSNSELITKVAEDPINNLEWTTTDSPFMFLAFCFEWAEYLRVGESFVSHIPVSFDGSCSGIQHFSAMLKDEVGGVAVNLVPDNKVHDIYKIVADKVKTRVKADYDNGTGDEILQAEDGNDYLKKGTKSLSKEWLDYGINRKVTKRPVMTLAYAAKQFGFKQQILDDTVYPALSSNPYAFSKPNQSAGYMALHIWETAKETVVKAMEAMEWLQEVSALLARDTDINGNHLMTYWVTPVGFPVFQAYKKTQTKRICTFLSGDITVVDTYYQGDLKEEKDDIMEKGTRLQLSVATPIEELDSRKQRQGIAPNFVHSMDANHLMMTVLHCNEVLGIDSFALIHDSFGTHSADAEGLFHAIREVFVNIYNDRNVLQDLHDHVENLLSSKAVEKLPPCPKQGTLDLNVVKESIYAFA